MHDECRLLKELSAAAVMRDPAAPPSTWGNKPLVRVRLRLVPDTRSKTEVKGRLQITVRCAESALWPCCDNYGVRDMLQLYFKRTQHWDELQPFYACNGTSDGFLGDQCVA